MYEMFSRTTNHISLLMLFVFLVNSFVGEAAPLFLYNSPISIEKSCLKDKGANDDKGTKASISADNQKTISKMVAEIPCAPTNHQFDNQFVVFLNSIPVVYTEQSCLNIHTYIDVIENPPTTV